MKILFKSVAVSAVITAFMTLINYFTAKFSRCPFFSVAMHGGEVTSWVGVGIIKTKYYPLSAGDEPSTERIVFSLFTLLVAFVLIAVVAALVMYVFSKRKKKQLNADK